MTPDATLSAEPSPAWEPPFEHAPCSAGRELEALLDALPGAICLVDGSWRITRVNRRTAELAREPAEGLIGLALWDFPVLAPDPALWSTLQCAMAQRVEVRHEAESSTLGTRMLVVATPFQSGLLVRADEITHGIAADDAQRASVVALARRAELRATTLQTLTAALSGALTEEEVGAVVLRQALPAFGAVAGNVVLLTDDDVEFRVLCWMGYPEDVMRAWAHYPADGVSPGSEVVRTGGPVFIRSLEDFESRYPVVGAILRANKLSAYAGLPLILGGRVRGVVSFNFPDHRAFSSETRAMMLAFAGQCAQAIERARLFAAERNARAEAEAADKAKSDFLAVMSHELRTPLTAILGYQELLADGMSGPMNDGQHFQLERIKVSALHLLQLIDELLTVSRLAIDGEDVAPQPVSVSTVLDEAVAVIAPLAAAKRLSLITRTACPSLLVTTDTTKLRKVLVNILGNAVKFTERGTVELSAVQDNGGVRIDVRDTGIGVAGEHVERIFEPFWQAENSTTRRTGGTGVGLSVSRGLVQLLGGRLSVTSELGVGSLFSVWIP